MYIYSNIYKKIYKSFLTYDAVTYDKPIIS